MESLVIVESPTKVTAHIPSRNAARLKGADPATSIISPKVHTSASGYGLDPRPLRTRSAREVAGQKLSAEK